MSEALFKKELCQTLDLDPPEPGKRIIRVPISSKKSVRIGFETEIDLPNSLQHTIPTDEEILAVVDALFGLKSAGNSHRGARS